MNAPEIDAPIANWLVYGDALQEAGDPRGELIALSHGVDEGRIEAATRDAYVEAHADALLGAAAAQRAHYAIRFKFCEIVGARVRITPDDDVTEILPALLDAAPRLAELELVADPIGGRAIELAPAIAMIASRNLRSLALVDAQAERSLMLVSREYDPDPNLVDFGPLAALWPSRVETLRIVVADSHQLEVGKLDAPELRTFELACLRYGDGYIGEAAPLSTALADARWPKLESLALRIPETFMANVVHEIEPYVSQYDGGDPEDDGDHDPVDWQELDGLLANLAKCTQLRRVALTSFESAGTLLSAIERAGLAPTVTELDLSDSGLSDNDARWMVARKPLFAKLERIVAERTRITDPGKLEALGCAVAHSTGAGARYRYVVGQE